MSDPRKTPWIIDESDFWEIESRDAQMEFLLRYAVLAPSSHNTQPWTFRVVPDGIAIYADYGRRLPVIDPADRELVMSIGAAIANLRIAGAHFGYESTVLYETRPEESLPVATVALRETCAPDRSLRALFPAITKRRTNRQPFEGREIDGDALIGICDFVDDNAGALQFVQPHDIARVADMIAEGDRIQLGRETYRAELADWLRPNDAGLGDGICADAFGVPDALAPAMPAVMRRIDLSRLQSQRDRELLQNAIGLVALTADDDRIALLRAGEILERFLLLVTHYGLQYSFLNQPAEVPELRERFSAMIRATHPPQLLIRVGYAPEVPRPAPRRGVADVMQPPIR